MHPDCAGGSGGPPGDLGGIKLLILAGFYSASGLRRGVWGSPWGSRRHQIVNISRLLYCLRIAGAFWGPRVGVKFLVLASFYSASGYPGGVWAPSEPRVGVKLLILTIRHQLEAPGGGPDPPPTIQMHIRRHYKSLLILTI